MVAVERSATRDGRFAYEAAGEPGAPALVFLHGIGGAARAFGPQLSHFGARLRALAWDMPGYGGSAALPQMTIANLAAALAAFLDALGLDRPILVGHSIGGMIVQQFVADRPDGARAVVLSGTSPAFGRPDGDWQRGFVEARLGPLDRGESLPQLAPRIVADLVGDDPDPHGVDLATACMAAVPEATYRAAVVALLGFDLREALARIAVPCLVLAGEKDTNAPAAMMRKMAERIRGAAYVCLDGAGHLANLEKPQAFNAALDAFLRERVLGQGAAA